MKKVLAYSQGHGVRLFMGEFATDTEWRRERALMPIPGTVVQLDEFMRRDMPWSEPTCLYAGDSDIDGRAWEIDADTWCELVERNARRKMEAQRKYGQV